MKKYSYDYFLLLLHSEKGSDFENKLKEINNNEINNDLLYIDEYINKECSHYNAVMKEDYRKEILAGYIYDCIIKHLIKIP